MLTAEEQAFLVGLYQAEEAICHLTEEHMIMAAKAALCIETLQQCEDIVAEQQGRDKQEADLIFFELRRECIVRDMGRKFSQEELNDLDLGNIRAALLTECAEYLMMRPELAIELLLNPLMAQSLNRQNEESFSLCLSADEKKRMLKN